MDTPTAILPATIDAVWTSVSTFFTSGLSSAITVITGNALLCAPLVVFVAAKVLGMAKGLFKIGGRRK